jgi:hypothetical protein
MVVFKKVANDTKITPPASTTIERSRVAEDARDSEHQHKRNLRGKQGLLSGDVDYGDASMQPHTSMPGIDVARRALSDITIPPFEAGGAGKHAPETITFIGG